MEKESGVTTMYMCREIDKGDMLLKDTVTLDPKETGDSLHDKLSMMGGPLLLKTIDKLEDGSAVRIPQCEEESTYACLLMWVSPFRDLRINGYLLLPEAYRSLSRLSSALSAKASALCPFCLTICF